MMSKQKRHVNALPSPIHIKHLPKTVFFLYTSHWDRTNHTMGVYHIRKMGFISERTQRLIYGVGPSEYRSADNIS